MTVEENFAARRSVTNRVMSDETEDERSVKYENEVLIPGSCFNDGCLLYWRFCRIATTRYIRRKDPPGFLCYL